jgi:hypothetical protein
MAAGGMVTARLGSARVRAVLAGAGEEVMEDEGRREGRRRRLPQGVRSALEAMEPRDLLSVAPLLASAPRVAQPDLLAEATLNAASPASLNPEGAISPLIGTGPTRRELARERFQGVFQGPVYVSGGRFQDQKKTIYFRGLGGSNMFLHGDYQMAIIIPADPAAPLFGEAYLQDKNTNSSGELGLRLQGLTPQAYDRQGRPTELTFTNDTNVYSGIYFADTASGTVKITYSKGSATAVFRGLVFTSGIFSPIANSDLYSRGGRLTPRSGRAH